MKKTVFTSGDEGELFLNGKSLGRQRKQPGVWDRAYRLRWDDVRYEPGVLEAVVYKDGREWARDVVKTTGSAAKLVLETESPALLADGEDVCYVNVSVRDAEGLVVPNAKVPVKFSVEGPAEIVATDNGAETDFDDFRRPQDVQRLGAGDSARDARPARRHHGQGDVRRARGGVRYDQKPPGLKRGRVLAQSDFAADSAMAIMV